MPPKTSTKTTSVAIHAPSHRSHIGSVRSLPATGRARRCTSLSASGEQPLSTSTATVRAASFIRPTGMPFLIRAHHVDDPAIDVTSTLLQRSPQFECGIDVGGSCVAVGSPQALEEAVTREFVLLRALRLDDAGGDRAA